MMAYMIIFAGGSIIAGIALGLFLVTKVPKFWIRKTR